jgi:hypothetical protein
MMVVVVVVVYPFESNNPEDWNPQYQSSGNLKFHNPMTSLQ